MKQTITLTNKRIVPFIILAAGMILMVPINRCTTLYQYVGRTYSIRKT